MGAMEVMDRYRAAWNAHDADACGALFTDDGVREWCVVPNALIGAKARYEGPADVADGIAAYIAAMPDLTVEWGATAETADGAIVEWRVVGHHTAAWGGWPPQGEVVDLPGVSVCRVKDGRIAEEKMYFDPDMMARNFTMPS